VDNSAPQGRRLSVQTILALSTNVWTYLLHKDDYKRRKLKGRVLLQVVLAFDSLSFQLLSHYLYESCSYEFTVSP